MTQRVLDLSRLLPGPLAGRMLAELGFEVLRVMSPAGDMTKTLSPKLYEWLEYGKSVETVDLKTPVGVERLKDLVADAAVLLETNRPGVMENLGVGPDVLRALNPGLTYVRIASYRDDANHAAPGHDLTYLAAQGLLPRFGDSWKGMQIADGSGAFWGVIAALDGLRKGGGFYEVYLEETAFALAYPPPAKLDGGIVCYAVYRAADAEIALGALEPHLWTRFCQSVGREDWFGFAFSETTPSNPVYVELQRIFQERPAQEWERLGVECGFPLRVIRPYQAPAYVLPWKRS
jgi:crotonobetainyl-CoA:carnitine CoA-transferase CaiB-like acyl-CoA transferase